MMDLDFQIPPRDTPVLEALTFNDLNDVDRKIKNLTTDLTNFSCNDKNVLSHEKFPCLLCGSEFSCSELEKWEDHLLIEHNLVVANFKNLPMKLIYIQYWKNKFLIDDYKIICLKDSSGNYVLNRQIPDDRDIREKLKNQKLQELLDIQRFEREDENFKKLCLFCNKSFDKNRVQYLNHLSEGHNFNLGPIENIVFIDELLNITEGRIKSLYCIYCEKLFKDNVALKEHMRKKRHKRLRASNAFYHKFLIDKHPEVNDESITDYHNEKLYNEENEDSEDEDGNDGGGDDDDDLHHCLKMKSKFSDWIEEPSSSSSSSSYNIHCLFCSSSFHFNEDTYQHLLLEHQFDLKKIISGISYYQCIKLVNYIRRQVHQLSCHICAQKFASSADVYNHFKATNHSSTLPPLHFFDQPQYYFPTYENDNLLCVISCDNDVIGDDNDGGGGGGGGGGNDGGGKHGGDDDDDKLVVAEDIHVPVVDMKVIRELLESKWRMVEKMNG